MGLNKAFQLLNDHYLLHRSGKIPDLLLRHWPDHTQFQHWVPVCHHFFDVLDEGFDGNDEYVVPLVEYLSCKLHYAKLLKNKAKRESIIWWVFTQLHYEGFYTRVFATYFDPLVKETNITIVKMLRKEYLLLQKQSA